MDKKQRIKFTAQILVQKWFVRILQPFPSTESWTLTVAFPDSVTAEFSHTLCCD